MRHRVCIQLQRMALTQTNMNASVATCTELTRGARLAQLALVQMARRIQEWWRAIMYCPTHSWHVRALHSDPNLHGLVSV